MAIPNRQLFRRGYSYTTVRPVRLAAGDFIPAGTCLDAKNLRPYHILSLWRRRLVGRTGETWTDWMLKLRGVKRIGEKKSDAEPETESRPKRKPRKKADDPNGAKS